MRKPKEIKMEVMKVHNLFWESYADRDIELRFSLCSEDVTFIGSGLHERAINKDEYKKINQEGVKQFPDPFQIEFLWTNLTILNDDIACVESEVVWSQLINTESVKELLRNTTILKYNNKKWLVSHVHGSVPDYRLKDGDYMTNEQTIIRNRELERQVFERTQDLNKTLVELEQKNRELEIEASLERVRAVAMSMNKSEDLLSICEASFKEFKKLGFDDIRNALIHIQYDEQKYFMDYDFSDLTSGAITKIEYGSHPVVEDYLKQIRSAKDAFYNGVIKEDQLEEWKEFRKNSGQIDDPRLDKATALYYYFFSIGIGDIGISTLQSIDESQTKILKRFRNVFDLAYRRYKDIELAEAQAREAQIEAALERVRSKAMAMHNSENLLDTISEFFVQLKILNIIPVRCGVAQMFDNPPSWTAAATNATIQGDSVQLFGKVEYLNHPVLKGIYDHWIKQENYFPVLQGEEIKKYYMALRPQINIPEFPEGEIHHGHYFNFREGNIFAWTKDPLSEEEKSIFARFSSVLSLTYRRYIDLEKAEALAREAEIELALERVRARTMGMQKSDELKEVIQLVYDQFVHLNIHIEHTGFILDYKARNDYNSWIADRFGSPSQITLPNFDCIYYNRFSEAKEKGLEFFAVTLSFEEKNKFYHDLFQHIPGFPEESKKTIFDAPAFTISTVLLENVALYIEKFVYSAYTEEENAILMRFGKVFQQTYTRFLDLQKAEAQTREAQIEAALERVRSKAMAMNSSEDLAITVDTFFSELNKLGIILHRCGVGIVDAETQVADIRATVYTKENVSKKIIGKLKLAGHPVLDNIFESWKLEQEYHPVLRGTEILEYYKVMNPQVEFPDFAEDQIQYGHYFLFKEGGVFAWTDKELKEEDLQIFRKYTSVLSLTYRRYAELKESEAQARETQIELALERVRARTMGMQKSEELREVIRIVYEQFVHLKINVDHAGFVVDFTPKGDWHFWIADEQENPSKITHPYFDSIWANQFNEAKEKGADFFITNLNFEEKNKFYNELLSYVPGLPEASKYFYLNCPGFAATTVLFDNVSLYIENFSGIPYSDDENKILIRFGKVFQQTYTRFLDLQKAEAQTREAQIEAALERVRARTMGMHLSSELHDVIKVVMEQLLGLGLRFNVTNFAKIHPDGSWDLWLFTPDQPYPAQLYVPYLDHPIFNRVLENIKTGADFSTDVYDKDEKDIFFRHFFENTAAKNTPAERKDYVYNTKGFTRSLFLTRNLWFAVVVYDSTPFTDEENAILKRFAGVFEQTYTRFLDLQKAEAQAREAKIESSLERVRARAMSMHTPNDLSATVSLFFKELKSLNVLPWRCGVGRIDGKTRTTYLTTTSITRDGDYTEVSGKLHQTGHPVLDGIFDHWKLQKEYYPVLRGEEINEYYSIIRPQIAYPDYPLDAVQYGHNIPFKEGFIFAWTENKLSEEELGIFRRFASVLSLTYRRYLDLTESEEQNRIIQAENDRKTKELEEARLLQLSMLPKILPQLPNLDIAVYMKTATEVGGDYYDFNVDADGTLTVLVGDATGHGMMSGMMVSIMKSFFISNRSNIELKSFFENSNNSIKDMNLGRLMMASMGVQITSKKIIATNAGMPSLLYFRNKSKKAGEFVSNNLPLGAMRGIKYSLKQIYYEKGDTLLLMSDGFAELKNENEKQYGYERVKEEFRFVAQKSSNEIVDHLKSSATRWINGSEQDDDVTFVVIKVI